MTEPGTRTQARSWRRPFFTIWTGQQISLVGSQVAQFALVWWLTTTTGSATVLASATLVALVPQIALGPIAGALVDRWDRRHVMIVADVLIALVSLGLAVVFLAGRMQVWHVYLVVLARSLGSAFHWPAMAASTSLFVPKDQLSRIAGLNQIMNGGLNIVSPAIGAFLISIMPLSGVMFVDAGTAMAGILPLFFIPIPKPPRAEVREKLSVWKDLQEGFRYVRAWPALVLLIAIALLIKLALTPAFSLLPLLVKNHFHGGPAQLGAFEAIFGVGVIAGGVLLGAWGGFRRKIKTIQGGVLILGVGITALAFAPGNVLLAGLACLFAMGFAIPMIDGPFLAILQATVAPEIQGRVFGVAGSLLSLSSPLGLVLAGPLSDRLGLSVWYAAAGVLSLLLGAFGFLIPTLRRIEEGSQALASSGDSVDGAALGAAPVGAGVGDEAPGGLD